MGVEKNSGIEKIKEAFKLLKESLKELDEVEYLLELLERELIDYRNLIDKETLIPKTKFIKQRICRLIDRMKFATDESLACVGIKISLNTELPEIDRRSIVSYIATYIDGHVRPYDMLFIVDELTLGVVFPLKQKQDLEAIIRRLETMLLNLKAKTYSSTNVLINFKLKSFFIDRADDAETVFKKLRD